MENNMTRQMQIAGGWSTRMSLFFEGGTWSRGPLGRRVTEAQSLLVFVALVSSQSGCTHVVVSPHHLHQVKVSGWNHSSTIALVAQKYLRPGTRAPGLDKHLCSAISASPAPSVPRSLGTEH
jgi:hypothetical protein